MIISVKHLIQFLAKSKHSVNVGYEKGLMTMEEEEGEACLRHPDSL